QHARRRRARAGAGDRDWSWNAGRNGHAVGERQGAMAGIGESAPPQKNAIVGGGIGALTAAYWLTHPSLGGRYEGTVYTKGWRAGGRGASGRNQKRNGRIEEHGLHIWFGTYHNAIALMRRCYAELGRPPGAPLATFDDAFKPQRRLVLLEEVAG